MSGFHESAISRAFLVLTIIMLIWLASDSYVHDNMSKRELVHNRNLWTIPNIDDIQQQHINAMIDNYFKRRSLNKSRYKKMIKSANEGAFRGAVGGCIMNGPAGIMPGAFLFGVLGAVNSGMNRRLHMDDRNLHTIDKF